MRRFSPAWLAGTGILYLAVGVGFALGRAVESKYSSYSDFVDPEAIDEALGFAIDICFWPLIVLDD